MTATIDRDAVLGGLRMLQLAHDRWHAARREMGGKKITGGAGREIALHAHGAAVEVATWARAIDDACKKHPDLVPDYPAARTEVADLLDAARYACNTALHQLTVLPHVIGGISAPLRAPIVADKMAGYHWAHERALPARDREHDDTQRRLREKYVALLAGRDMKPALDRLRGWFERMLTQVTA